MTPAEATIYQKTRKFLECVEDTGKWWSPADFLGIYEGPSVVDLDVWTIIRILQRGMVDCRGKHFEFRHQPNVISSDVRYQVRALVHCKHPDCVVHRIHAQ